MSGGVILKQVGQYDPKLVEAAVEEILVASGIETLLRDRKRVLIKPNLLARFSPDEAVTTHPVVMEAVVKTLKAYGADTILISDSPGGLYSKAALKSVYHGCGYDALGDIPGVTLNLDTESREVLFDGERIKGAELTLPTLDADLIISVGKLKTHAMSGMTGAVKNLFGCIPGLMKAEMHCRFPKREEFCDMLIDLAEFIQPQISLIDGILGMEGDGPSGGTPRYFGILGGSNNPYYLDRVLAHCIGMRPDEALTVKSSIERGLAPKEAGEISIYGDLAPFQNPITDLKKPRSAETDFSLKVPKIFRRPAKAFLNATSAHPAIIKKLCIGCGKCKEICPQKTIAIVNRKAVIERQGCIRCFCCHEVCPERAIDIKRSAIWGL